MIPMTPFRSSLAVSAAVAAAVLLASAPVAGQAIEGAVVEVGSDRAVAGAFVLLLDEAGRRVDAALTDGAGRYRVKAPGPGRYRLALERIGYAGATTGPIALAAGEVREYGLTAALEPVTLAAIDATVERDCAVRPAEGEAAARLWEEVRKALAAAALTRDEGLVRYTIVGRERRLDPEDLEILEESTRTRAGFARGSPYVALDAERLVRDGFVVRQGEEWIFYGPDAGTLLSDAFLDTHCFRPRHAPVAEPGLVGLAFEPAPGRDVAEVAGVLWIDRETAELRRLEYDFVGLPRELRHAGIGGFMEFERVPTGEWIVRRWWIRTPMWGAPAETPYGHLRMDAARDRARVVVLVEQGGEVTQVAPTRASRLGRARGGGPRMAWAEPIPLGPGALAPAPPRAPARAAPPAEPGARTGGRGVVVLAVDAATGEPLEGVQVATRDAAAGGQTDPAGRLRLGGLPPGRHEVTIERLGYAPLVAAVQVPPEGWRTFRATLSPAAVPAEPVEATVEADRIERSVGEARYRLTADDIPDQTPLSVPELIAYRMPGVRYIRTTGADTTGGRFERICPYFETRNGPVDLVIVDGVRYRGDACVMEFLEPRDILEIAVVISYAGQLEFGPASGGVIIIRTKRGAARKEEGG